MGMLLYIPQGGRMETIEWSPEQSIPPETVWLDLFIPTREEDRAAEKFLGISIPTREEMHEIEVSNRLYQEDGATFMTATMLSKVDSGAPESHAVTFIATKDRLVTVRYVDTTSFRRFSSQFIKSPPKNLCGNIIFLALLEAIINRIADILERLDREIDRITHTIFRHRDAAPDTSVNYQKTLEQIGRCGDIAAKIHESLVTFGRVSAFAKQYGAVNTPEQEVQLASIRSDITGLNDHGTHLTQRVTFLLDATLGMINIQQNAVFRVLSIASLVFLPPTLVAGVYGMNFKLIPELNWHWGYPLALLLMLFAAVLPYAYLRQRKWL